MRRKLILSSTIIFVLTFSFVVVAEAQSSTMWNQTYGGTGYDGATSLVETVDGYAIAGYTSSFGAGMHDVWLIKTDEFGSMEWNQTYGGTSSDFGWSVVETSDGGYAIAGYTESFGAGNEDFWLVKTDENGNMQWNQTYGGPDEDWAESLVETVDGYAIAGYTNSSGAGASDFWLVKTDASGNMQWNQTYGGTANDYGYSVVTTNDGGYAIAGETWSFGAGFSDFWLIKTDASGNMQWNQTYGGTSSDWGYSVVETNGGGYAIAGETMSFGAELTDFWLIKTDVDGNEVWNRTYGGPFYQHAHSLVATSDGGYAIAGNTLIPGAGWGDFWLIKTDVDGNEVWNQTYGGPDPEAAYSLVATSDGGYAIAGDTYSFGAGGYDAWLIKSDETGVIPEYSSWLLPSLLFVATFIIVIYKKKLFKHVHNYERFDILHIYK